MDHNKNRQDTRGPARDGFLLWSGDELERDMFQPAKLAARRPEPCPWTPPKDTALVVAFMFIVRAMLTIATAGTIMLFVAAMVVSCGAVVVVTPDASVCPVDMAPDDGAPCDVTADCCPAGLCFTPTCIDGRCVVVWTHDNDPCLDDAGTCMEGECLQDGGAP